ncbi:MAG: CDP-diacylglycerol--glycerol-3-phosphate 3-phosphatidyltransferase [Porticoccaceae bacterium]
MWNLPNLLTFLRILLIPLLVLVYYLPIEGRYLLAAAIFALAAVTDWFDGYLARKLDQTTAFGAFLDPVADKLIVAVALVILVQSRPELLVVLPTMIIIGREILISALREWMAEMGRRTSVAVSMLGKVKTTLQMIAIMLLLLADPSQGGLFNTLGILMLYAAAILTLWSMILYLSAAWPRLTGKE